MLLRREQLVYRALTAHSRLVSIMGVPGSGRSTLLGQISEAIREQGDTLTYLTAKAVTDVAYLKHLLAPELAAGKRHYLLIDDFEWVLAHDGATVAFAELLRRNPAIHAVLVTIDRLPAEIAPEFEGVAVLLKDRDLSFSLEETAALVALRLGYEDSAKARMVFEVSGGFVDAAARAVEMLAVGDVVSLPDAIAQALVHSRAEVYYNAPEFVLAKGFLRLGWELSFVPRFSLAELQRKEAQYSKEAVQDLINSQSVTRQVTGFATEYLWKPTVWQVYCELNADSPEIRENLVASALDRGDFSMAFEQYLFLGNYSAAEDLAEKYWLSIFRALTPEGMDVVSAGLGSYLQGYPLVSAMGIYAADGVVPRGVILGTLRLLRKKSTGTFERPFACTLDAVTALVLLRDHKYEQAASTSMSALTLCLDIVPEVTSQDAEQLDACALALEVAEVCVGVRLSAWEVFAHNSQMIAALPAEIVDYMSIVTGFTGRLHSAGRKVRRTPLARASGKFANDKIMELVRTNSEALTHSIGDFRPDFYAILPANTLLLSSVISADGMDIADDQFTIEDLAARVRKFFGALVEGKLDAARTYFDQALSMTVYSKICLVCLSLATANYVQIKQLVLTEDALAGQRMVGIIRFFYAVALAENQQTFAAVGQLTQAWEQHPDESRIATILMPKQCFKFLDNLDQSQLPAALVAQIAQGRELDTSRIPVFSAVRELTEQERKIVSSLYRGLTVREICEQLYLSANTVRAHIRNARICLGADNREDLVAKARSFGFIDTGSKLS